MNEHILKVCFPFENHILTIFNVDSDFFCPHDPLFREIRKNKYVMHFLQLSN